MKPVAVVAPSPVWLATLAQSALCGVFPGVEDMLMAANDSIPWSLEAKEDIIAALSRGCWVNAGAAPV